MSKRKGALWVVGLLYEYLPSPIQVIWCMSLLFPFKVESETAANLGDLDSVLMSFRNGLGEEREDGKKRSGWGFGGSWFKDGHCV